jgi:uncharacterized protein
LKTEGQKNPLRSTGITKSAFLTKTPAKGQLMQAITINVNDQKYQAELSDTPTAQKLWDALPIEGQANLWGEEIYFEIPVSAPEEADARQDVDVGTIAYWPAGSAFCIFFGPTPVSTDEKPKAYSPVNILGRVERDVAGLKQVQQGETVRIEKINP